MGTRGAPRFRAAVLGLRLAPVLLAAGCAGPAATGDDGPPPASPTAHRAASPSPRVTSPAELCARVVAHWSRKVLDQDTYGDYQSMGLSNGQYEILRRAVAAARPVRRHQGLKAAQDVIDRQVRAGCADRYRDGVPGEGPWQ
ncbi:hypothetical protein [Streptomyces sp. NPDC018610]|uniref:hypothetical protein n=1 Tax=Streptomyces sp. NPDC018610 TaxID=3365049 RepID=UPI0037ABF80A